MSGAKILQSVQRAVACAVRSDNRDFNRLVSVVPCNVDVVGSWQRGLKKRRVLNVNDSADFSDIEDVERIFRQFEAESEI